MTKPAVIIDNTVVQGDGRADLRAAIAAREAACVALHEANAAVERAAHRTWDLHAEIDALHARAETAQSEADTVAQVVSALAAGHDVASISSPTSELQSKIKSAEDSLRQWQAARELAQSAIAPRQQALEAAERNVDSAIRALLLSEADVDRLLAKGRKLQQEFGHVRLLLQAIGAHAGGSDVGRSIAAFLREPVPAAEGDGAWRTSEVTRPMLDWLAALRGDADAPQPPI